MPNNSQKLTQLINQLENDFQKLPLANKPSDIVPPAGNPDAEIMFIGEAAGYHEHLQRKPFVGLAGKLLTRTLIESGMQRADVWISNILKVRPPQNRDPLPEEIASYAPYLDAEIEIIKPKIIVTLGRFSMGKFLKNAFISQVHGQARWIDWKNTKIIIFPMYHPAAALRNGKVMQSFKADFSKLSEIINILKKPQAAKSLNIFTEEAVITQKDQQLHLI